MPSFRHELLVELFRRRPALAAELLRACAGLELPAERAELGSIDLSQIAPAEYHADAVVVCRDERGNAASAIVVEVQLAADEDKRFTWPLYVAAARARLRCPVTLLVISPDPIARWARRPIPLGHPRHVLEPIVIGLGDVPRVVDPEDVSPELAVLSTVGHADVVVARVALAAISVLPSEIRELYFDVIIAAAPPDLRRALEDETMPSLKGFEYQSDFVRKYFYEGKAEGQAEGRREALQRLLERKFGPLAAEHIAQLAAAPIADLDTFLDRILTADSIDAVFAR